MEALRQIFSPRAQQNETEEPKNEIETFEDTNEIIKVLLNHKPGQPEYHEALKKLNELQGEKIETFEQLERDARIKAVKVADREAALAHLNYKTIGKFIDETYTPYCTALLITYLDGVLITDEKQRYEIITWAIAQNINSRTQNEAYISKKNRKQINKLNERTMTIVVDRPWWGLGLIKRSRKLNTRDQLNNNRALAVSIRR